MSTWALPLYTFSHCQICLKWCSLGWNICRHHELSKEHLFIIVIAYSVATLPIEGRITWSRSWMSTWAIVFNTFSQCQICFKWCSLGWNVSIHDKLSNEHLFIIVIAHVVATLPVEGQITWSPTWISKWALALDTFSQYQICFKWCSLDWNICKHHELSNEHLLFIVIAHVVAHLPVEGQVTWSPTCSVDMSTRFRHVFAVSNMFQMMFFMLKHI